MDLVQLKIKGENYISTAVIPETWGEYFRSTLQCNKERWPSYPKGPKQFNFLKGTGKYISNNLLNGDMYNFNWEVHKICQKEYPRRQSRVCNIFKAYKVYIITRNISIRDVSLVYKWFMNCNSVDDKNY